MPAAQHIDCDRQFVFGEQRCKRTYNHLGLHRDTRRMKDATVMWGDNECTPQQEST
jgi:hypothetical protein